MALSFKVNLGSQLNAEKAITAELQRQLVLTQKLVSSGGQLEAGVRRREAGLGAGAASLTAPGGAISRAPILREAVSTQAQERIFKRRFDKNVKGLVSKVSAQFAGKAVSASEGVQAFSTLTNIAQTGNVSLQQLAFPNVQRVTAKLVSRLGGKGKLLGKIASGLGVLAAAAPEIGLALLAADTVRKIIGNIVDPAEAGTAFQTGKLLDQQVKKVFNDPLDPNNKKFRDDLSSKLRALVFTRARDKLKGFFQLPESFAEADIRAKKNALRLIQFSVQAAQAKNLGRAILNNQTDVPDFGGTSAEILDAIRADIQSGQFTQDDVRGLRETGRQLTEFAKLENKQKALLASPLVQAELRDRELRFRQMEKDRIMSEQDWNPN